MKRWARLYCLAAGACDSLTGLLLIAAPRMTLGLMQAGDGPSDPVWMRFIGAFVLGVGLVYLYGLAREPRGGARLAHLMEATTLVRVVIALFTAAAIARGELSPAWLSVSLTDAAFAIVQIVFARKDAFAHEA